MSRLPGSSSTVRPRRDVAAAFPDLAPPDFEFRVPAVYRAPGVFLGLEGIEDWMTMIDEAWAEWRFEPERYLEAGSTVVVLALLVAEGGSSGIHLEREVGHLWAFDKGRATGLRVYLDRATPKPPGFTSSALDKDGGPLPHRMGKRYLQRGDDPTGVEDRHTTKEASCNSADWETEAWRSRRSGSAACR